ncbi:MAG: chloride channel protein [Ardenticatenaceae bacterium]|nr:chloride channel protein [Anaerolineales bacterium]MCB8940623.1 chloride channel protein [Ardenticatenaceae bacterium]MCB8971953.1 chloride channel protein [Ardenticatenaceae bacterium]
MRSIGNALLDALKHLNIVRNLPKYFDEEEQRLAIQSVIIGVVVWAIVFSLKTAVHWLFETTLHLLESGPSPWLLFIPLLLGAFIVAWLAQIRPSTLHYRDKQGHIHELNDVEGDGMERAISLYYTSEPSFEQALTGQEGVEVRWELPTFSLAIRKFLATLATLGSGGSGGLEASVTLIGESVAAGLFKPRTITQTGSKKLTLIARFWRWWQPDRTDHLQTAQLSGIAAAVAVLLGTPFAAAFFASEVMYRYRPVIEKLVYALISAMVAFFLTDLVTEGHPVPFETDLIYVPPSTLPYFAILILLGVVVSLVSQYFRRLRVSFEHGFYDRQPNIWRRHLLGAFVTGLIAITVHYATHYFNLTEHGLELVLGPGESVVNMAFAGELTIAVALIALVAKMIATLATITSGGSAGLLVPTLFFGTMVASILANIFNYEPMVLIVPAMVASLVSIANVPLAAILFAVEAFGSVYMVPALFMMVIGTILAHEQTIYRTQRETYESRQILPGVSVRRLSIPARWANRTLIDIDFRRRFDLNVIGLVEYRTNEGSPRVRLGTASSTILEEGDTLIVLGRDEKLAELEAFFEIEYAKKGDVIE